jgi:serine/threonine protein kinase
MIEGELEPGVVLAGYRIERFIARGGMGAVYEATQLSLDRRVALKFISAGLGAEEHFRERFRREARSAAAIDHPNILPVYEAGELEDGRLFLAMRLVDGPDLSSALKEQGPMEPGEAVAVLSQVGEALDAAHAKGLVHRDVKPANVMLEMRTGGWHAYLTDFGLAKPNDPGLENTATGELLGTIDYMAPEQINGEALDGRVDIYAFGCMVYRCLTDELPFRRDSRTATMMAHANAPTPLPSAAVAGLPAPLDVVVERAMEKDRDKRAPSAGALMRWADEQLRAGAPAVSLTTDESPTEETLVTEPQPQPQPVADSAGEKRPRLSLRVATALSAVAYAPLWAAAYLLGRHL